MSKSDKPRKKRGKLFKLLIVLIIVLGVFELTAFGAIAYYLSDYEHADADAEAATKSGAGVRVSMTDDWIEFIPSGGDQKAASAEQVGIIFYPGGKVEYTAYAPLMKAFAGEGYFCALVKMPFNLAVLDSNAAKDVKEAHPEMDRWIIGGHSLGGAMAAKYAAISDFDGLFLLGAYATTDLSDKAINVVSIYGDADGVLNMESYQEYKSNLPADTKELIIEGGNHSQFGSYGLQEGDGEAGISADEQRSQTVRFVLDNLL